MPVPESQLETWSHQGAVATAKSTHESIRNALNATASPIRGKNFEVYLQGSYKNDTNIRGDSDVDVVVQLNSAWGRDLSALTDDQKRLYQATYPNATYLWQHFREDVLKALRAYYGSGPITEENRSIKLAAGSGRLAADIVVALHFRKYVYFYGDKSQMYVEGIRFHARRDGREIINFPKPHYDNGVKKNAGNRTNGRYKPIVRMFKNGRTYLIDRHLLSADVAPSYFLECLLYNVPDSAFGSSFQHSFATVFDWLGSKASVNQLVCQNEQLPLFGSAPEQWDSAKARQMLQALRQLWENWR
jgi:predicted nucleotidyltransferase